MLDSDSSGAPAPSPANDATVQPVPSGPKPSLELQCAQLASSPDILGAASSLIEKLGVAGEDRIARILYLVMTSRVLDRPVSLIIKGHSSGGKSFLLKTVLKLFPAEAYWLRASISPKLIVRTTESFIHRVLVFEEAAGLNRETEYFLRVLLSEGQIVYSTLSKGASGNWEEEIFTKDGPTGLVLTTTEVGLHPENETRMLSVSITDTREQTRKALVAAAETRGIESDTAVHHAFQHWISLQSNRVRVPFLRDLAEKVAPVGLRIRRDFNLVVSLIEAHAILHQATRSRDADGALLATIDDYRAVYVLVADIISQGVEASVPPAVRETVEAVRSLLPTYPGGAPVIAVADALGIDKSGASRRVKVAIAGGYVVNLEDSKGKPQRLILGDPLPDGGEILPEPGRIGCAVAADLPNTQTEQAL
jgi:hypothetical protein